MASVWRPMVPSHVERGNGKNKQNSKAPELPPLYPVLTKEGSWSALKDQGEILRESLSRTLIPLSNSKQENGVIAEARPSLAAIDNEADSDYY